MVEKNYYKDKKERCFILGTGTSLNELDLSLLKDEITISINLILHKEEFDEYVNREISKIVIL